MKRLNMLCFCFLSILTVVSCDGGSKENGEQNLVYVELTCHSCDVKSKIVRDEMELTLCSAVGTSRHQIPVADAGQVTALRIIADKEFKAVVQYESGPITSTDSSRCEVIIPLLVGKVRVEVFYSEDV